MTNQIVAYITLGIITIVIFIFLNQKMKPGFGQYNLKVYGISLIALLTVVLVISDIDPNKGAAAYGILGAIAGYLFGIKNSD